MATQHTPGEWKFFYDDKRDNYQIYADKIWIATTKGDACSKSQEANAHLMAAAPDLLQAVIDCVDNMPFFNGYSFGMAQKGILSRLKAAIKKARGEE